MTVTNEQIFFLAVIGVLIFLTIGTQGMGLIIIKNKFGKYGFIFWILLILLLLFSFVFAFPTISFSKTIIEILQNLNPN